MAKSSKIAILALACALAACGNTDEKKPNNGEPNNGEPNNGEPNNGQPNNGEPNNGEPNNGEPNNGEPNNNPGACDGVANPCDIPGSSCAGNSAVVCSADANGCLVETTTDCGATAQQCQAGGCVSVDPCTDDAQCAGIADGESACTGDELVTCNANAEGCLVATTEDCAAAGGICDSDTNACITECTDAPECAGLADGDAACLGGATTVSCALNAAGCLEATTVACAAGELCDDSGDAPVCAGACAEAIQNLSCADAGMTISGNTASGSTLFGENSCWTLDPYPGTEAIYTFANADEVEVTISFTLPDPVAADVFVNSGGACTDDPTTLSCVSDSFAPPGVDTAEVTFSAGDNEPYYVILEPYGSSDTFDYGFTIDCTPVVCGNGAITGSEQCDDGNDVDGDGCSSTCELEENFECDDAEPTVCTEVVCGDGIIAGDEQCDDGNDADGDGCSSTCEFEENFECDGAEPSVCNEIVCGDGIVATTEQCDDGNDADGDGCSSACEVEAGYDCSTGVCVPNPDLGTFGPGDPIPDTTNTTGLAAGDSDHYVITFTEVVVLHIVTSSTGGDLDIVVYDDAGTTVASGYRVGDEDFSTVLPAGTYTIEVDAYSAATGYTLSLSTLSYGTLGTFAGGDPIPDATGSLAPGARDVSRVTFTDDVLLDATVSSTSGDPELEVRTNDGVLIVRSAGVGTDEVLGLVLPAGSYLVVVEAWSGGADVDPYTLTLSTTALSTTDLGTVGVGDTIADQTGALAAEASDYYVVTFSETVTATVTLGGNTTGETSLRVLNAAFDVFGSETVGDETLAETFAPGRYLIAIDSEPGDPVDAYTLSFSL